MVADEALFMFPENRKQNYGQPQQLLIVRMSLEQSSSIPSPRGDHKDRDSGKTMDSPSSLPLPAPSLPLPALHPLFQNVLPASALSEKITRRSTSWLVSVAWARDFSLQASWTALVLFYGYRQSKHIDKLQLEGLLLTCLQLATKLHDSVALTTRDMLLNCTRPISRDILFRFEHELLELFDYSLYVPHALQGVLCCPVLGEQQRMKVLFLAQLYLLRGHSILFDNKKVQRLVELVGGQCVSELQSCELREMLNDGCSDILLKKFGSMFDVDAFVDQLL